MGVLGSLLPGRPAPAGSGWGARPAAFLFLSPNTDERLAPEQAVARLRSPAHRHFRNVAEALLDQLNLGRRELLDGVGDWGDGAENSLLVLLFRPPDRARLGYAAAWFGLLADQKSVLVFIAHPDGPDAVFRMDVPQADLTRVRRLLDQNGIPWRTLLAHPPGYRVVVYDEGRRLGPAFERLAGLAGTTVEVTAGRGFAVAEATRRRARSRYRQEIRRYEEVAAVRVRPDRLPLPGAGR